MVRVSYTSSLRLVNRAATNALHQLDGFKVPDEIKHGLGRSTKLKMGWTSGFSHRIYQQGSPPTEMKGILFFVSPLPRFSASDEPVFNYFLLSQHGDGRCVRLHQSTGFAFFLLGLRTTRTFRTQHPFTRD